MGFNPLGQQTDYVSVYSPELLFPIARADSRRALNIAGDLPFFGQDLWTAYELSWLDLKGKPQVAVAEFLIPCDSEFIIESKSFKLYLNSLNQTRFATWAEVNSLLVKDLSAAAGAPVGVHLYNLGDFATNPLQQLSQLDGQLLDDLDVEIDSYHPQPDYLQTSADELVDQVFYSHLLKTNCPVTGQPDWASLVIAYKGPAISPESLLRYIVSFREHQDFHEHCVERIYCDIQQRCQPDSLSVYARYTRRGGLDINPFRCSQAGLLPESLRLVRQ